MTKHSRRYIVIGDDSGVWEFKAWARKEAGNLAEEFLRELGQSGALYHLRARDNRPCLVYNYDAPDQGEGQGGGE